MAQWQPAINITCVAYLILLGEYVYFCQLTVDELRANYEKERDNLKAMMPEQAEDDVVNAGTDESY